MNIYIKNGIQLPAFDVEMLNQGKLIIVPFIGHLKEGQVLLLYPSQEIPHNLSLYQYYQMPYLKMAEETFDKYKQYPIELKTWARCEKHLRINLEQKYLLPKIAQSTIWNLSALDYLFNRYKFIKLYILRVHQLSKPHVVNIATSPGPFYWSQKPINLASKNDISVVNDACFQQRKRLFLADKSYQHRDLQGLHLQMLFTTASNSATEQLNFDIQQFLGLNFDIVNQQVSSEFDWIKTISELGDRTQEQEQKKNHYQAGTDFENITCKALEFLGFQVDENHKGGAGGLDLYCSEPYPVVIECKCGKSIPNNTVEELLKLGGTHLGADKVIDSTKLIIAPNYAKPTQHTLKASKQWKVSIIKAMSLQKLVELKAQYPGSINLLELKPYLEAGVIDHKIQEYIDKVNQDIEVRSQIIQVVKGLGVPGSKHESDAIASVYNYKLGNKENLKLDINTVHDLLIELSSPLTGYLGRTKDKDWKSDKFYFLRDLTNELI